MLWTPYKTDTSYNPLRLMSRTSSQTHRPTAHMLVPLSESLLAKIDHDPDSTVILCPHVVKQKTHMARDVHFSTNQCYRVNKGKKTAMLHRDCPRLASESSRVKDGKHIHKQLCKEKKFQVSQKIRCDAQQTSAMQP